MDDSAEGGLLNFGSYLRQFLEHLKFQNDIVIERHLGVKLDRSFLKGTGNCQS